MKKTEYLGGDAPALADREAYDELKGTLIEAKSHPHTFAWFCLIGSFAEPARQSWTAADPAQGGGKKEGKKGKGGGE